MNESVQEAIDHVVGQTIVEIRSRRKIVNLRPYPQVTPLKEIERTAIVDALAMCKGVQKEAARILKISPRVINYKMKRLGINRPLNKR